MAAFMGMQTLEFFSKKLQDWTQPMFFMYRVPQQMFGLDSGFAVNAKTFASLFLIRHPLTLRVMRCAPRLKGFCKVQSKLAPCWGYMR